MAWVSRTAVIAAALMLATTRGTAREYSYEPGERSDPWEQGSISSDPHWLMDQRSACWAYDSNAGASDSISWSGGCPFGRADGHGTLTFYDHGRIFEQLTGNFDAGMLEDGRVSITWADGSHYDGQEKDGQFNGYGVLINADGTRYDGLWRNDKFVNAEREGSDEVTGASGSTGSEGSETASTPDANNSGLPPANDMPFKMSTAAAKPAQSAPKPQAQQQAAAKPQVPATPAPAVAVSPAKWAFLIGKHPRLVTADGSKLSFSVTDGALAREMKRPDGSVAKDSLVFVSETSGAVRNEKGDAIATFQTRNHGIAIDYSDGSSEIVSADPRGLRTTAQTKGEQTIETRWYPEGHRFTRAERKRAVRQLAARLAAERIAAAKAERAGKPETRLAAAPVQHVSKPETRVAQAADAPANDPPRDPPARRPAPATRHAIGPIAKPESIAAATDLPTPSFKPELHIAARLHKRHAEPPVQVATAAPPVRAPSQAETDAPQTREVHEAARPDHAKPVREAQAPTAHAAPAQEPPAPPPVTRETRTASVHEAPAHASPTHPKAVREAEAATPHENQKPDVSPAPVRESPQPPVTHPAPPAVHVASVPPPAPQPPAAHAVATVTTQPVHVASSTPPAPVPVHVASATPAAPHIVRPTTQAPPVVHAAAPAPPAAPTRLATSSPTAPVAHAPTATTSTVPVTHAAPPAPAIVHVTTPPPPTLAVARVVPPPAPTPAVAHATTPPLPTQAVVRATPPAPTPAVEHATALPQQPATPALHVAQALPPPTHTLLPQTSTPAATRRSASECLALVSNGTHWGFRNNCDNDIQFAYCIMNGTDRLTACGDSAVPGSVAGHGFTSLIADLSMRDSATNRSFRWVGCNGGAGEVVPRLDRADPPMGRCLHASDLPQGAERADAGKKLAK